MSNPNASKSPPYPPQDPSEWYREPFYPPAYAPQPGSLSIASLVCGILAWTAVPFVCAIVAIITGHMALGEIRRDPHRVGGRGLAVVGMLLGYLQMLLVVLGIALIVLFFGYAASHSASVRETVNVPVATAERPKLPAGTIATSGDEIERRVVAILAPMARLREDQIAATNLLSEDLKLQDSDRIDLIVKLEEEFRIKLRPGESQVWKTVADVAASIRRREPRRAIPRSDAGLEAADPAKAPNP